MTDPSSLVENSEKLSAFFGEWPSFHDAEVVDLHLWRGMMFSGDGIPGNWDPRNILPVMTVKIRVLRATQANLSGKDAEVTLRFHDFAHLDLKEFNHVNQLGGDGLTVGVISRGKLPNGDDLPPYLSVVFENGFGMKASFLCFRIEVLEVTEYSPEEP